MASEQQSGFAHSLTDLMASVAVMFLLVAAIFMVRSMNMARKDRARLQAAAKKQSNSLAALRELRHVLEDDPAVKEVAAVFYDETKDPFVLTVVVQDRKLSFEPGECRLSGTGLSVVRERFPNIFRPVCQTVAQGFVENITLEGHTDATPFYPTSPKCGIDLVDPTIHCGGRGVAGRCEEIGYENNVRLSASRAQNVYFETRRLFSDETALRSCLDTHFIISGRGPVEPMDGRDWHASRSDEENQRNRRVVLKIRVRSDADLLAQLPAGGTP